MSSSSVRPLRPSGLRRVAAIAVPALGLLLAGCSVGPDFARPALDADAGYVQGGNPKSTASASTMGGTAQAFVSGQDVPGRWWEMYGSKKLSRLVETAMAASPDVAAAQATLRQAQENTLAAGGALLPAVDGSTNASRQQTQSNSSGKSIYNLFSAGVSVTYALDVFGGTRRSIESLEAQAEFQRYQLEATYLALTANVVTAAVQEASLREQISATNEILRSQQDALNLLEEQVRLGAGARADVLSQQSTLAQTRATLPPLEKALAQQRNQLAVLIGRFPNAEIGASFRLSDLKLPRRLPLSVPSQLVAQRPDVRAAEATLHAASAEVGVAIANQLPQFSITADLGASSQKLNKLLTDSGGVWSIGAGLTQPIFDGGTLFHRRKAAEAAYEAAAAQYRSTVLSAFQEVADAIRALQSDADALRASLAAHDAAAASLELTREQFQAGAVAYLNLLTAQQTYQSARLNLVSAQAARFADTAALFQALGGGWWNRVPPPEQTVAAAR
ncbi:efflux transporter outer membrane subunit [Methylobrevis pamukkalensis]|nr:efflux transporter outer membrane subunit [Methylobrevis pamukkalensis]